MSSSLHLGRRSFLASLACLTAGAATAATLPGAPDLHQPLPAWTEGHLDLHHIDTGRGNSTLVLYPDGSSLLIDAGAVPTDPSGSTAPARPDSSRSPGQSIAEYIRQHAPAPQLDLFLATHIHPDHIAGLPDLASLLPIATCIDRGFPDFGPHPPPALPATAAYLDLLRNRVSHNQPVLTAAVGSTTQLAPLHRPACLHTQILSANGTVWNPATQRVDNRLGTTPASENPLSISLRLTLGPFSYLTGGDLTSETEDGRLPALDIESPVALASGRTDVVVANHHAYFDSCGPTFARALDAQVYIIPSWDVGHPGSAQLQRLLGAWHGKATHDVFALELHPANQLLNRRFVPLLRSSLGHVVVRVSPGGRTFTIYTLDPTVPHGAITGIFGPYQSRA